jgi:hypothetical protein
MVIDEAAAIPLPLVKELMGNNQLIDQDIVFIQVLIWYFLHRLSTVTKAPVDRYS